jgi:hypothetical protein
MRSHNGGGKRRHNGRRFLLSRHQNVVIEAGDQMARAVGGKDVMNGTNI